MNFAMAAKALLVNDLGHILVLRRSMTAPHAPGGWDMPGGRLNPAEDMLVGLLREVKEETGYLMVFPVAPVHLTRFVRDDGQTVLLTVYLCLTSHDEPPALSYEHDKYYFIPLDEAEQSEFVPDRLRPAIPNAQSIVQLLSRHKP